MARFYGKPTKLVRHATVDDEIEIEPQRLRLFPFWKHDSTVSAYSDGDDVTTKTVRTGSRMANHRVNIKIRAETIEPQELYMGVVKLSFHDIMSPYVCGSAVDFDSNGDTTLTATGVTNYMKMWPEQTGEIAEPTTGNIDLSLTNGISDVKLDDHFPHWVQLKKPLIIFDQRPLISNRKMKIPAKVKRANPFTYYGLWVWNDSPRGATPSDTSVYFDMKQYFDEWAI